MQSGLPRATYTADTRFVSKAGEEVMSCYGAKDSGSLLLRYGFVPWRNAAEAVPLRVAAAFPPPPPGEPQGTAAAERARGRKQHLFAQLAAGGMALVATLRCAPAPLPAQLLAAARVCCMTAAEAAAARGDVAGALAGPVGADNERAALRRARSGAACAARC